MNPTVGSEGFAISSASFMIDAFLGLPFREKY
jgi:hypothetical protein